MSRPLSNSVKADYVARALSLLQEVATKSGQTIPYSVLMSSLGGPGRGHIGEVLEEISSTEHAAKRPLLTAIVVRKGTTDPGEGYWGLSMHPSRPADRKERHRQSSEEQRKVWAYWKK
jgi:hypothetical protein